MQVQMQNQLLEPQAAVRDLKERPVLAAGDAAAIVVFAGIGRMNHASDDGSVLLTALPFLVSWFLVAPLLGAYRCEVVLNSVRSIGRMRTNHLSTALQGRRLSLRDSSARACSAGMAARRPAGLRREGSAAGEE